MKGKSRRTVRVMRLLSLCLSCLLLGGCLQPNAQEPKMEVNANRTGFVVTGVGKYFVDSIVIPEKYAPPSSVYKYPVEDIAASAFSGCEVLTSIVIPDTIKRIGKNAFEGCTGLTTVRLPKNLMFIDDYLFAGCTGLTSVVFPENKRAIGAYAFDGCANLRDFPDVFPSDYVKEYAFRGTGVRQLILPGEHAYIGAGAFSQCKELTKVVFPDHVTSIGEGAFADCVSLEMVTMPTSFFVEVLSDRVFYNCTSLTDIKFPGKNLKYIGAEVFYNCDSLTNITVPDNIDAIGEKVFYDCDGLERVDFIYEPPSNWWEEIGGCRVGAEAFANCDSLSTVYFTYGRYKFGADAFAGCENLKDVYIEEIMWWVDSRFENEKSNPMYYAENLYLDGKPITGHVFLPDGNWLEEIPSYIFKNCTGITSIYIPSEVTSISANAFYGCTNLKRIEFGGYMADWEAITKDGWNNGLGSCVVECNDGEITVN